MRLLEYDGKQLLAEWGIAIPKGILVSKKEELAAIARIGGRSVLKIQAPAGKRGKAGGIRVISTEEEAMAFWDQWYGRDYSDYTIRSILAEEPLDIASEIYLSVTLDPRTGNYLLIFCPEGGVDIEEVAKRSPEKVSKIPLKPGVKYGEAEFRKVFTDLKLSTPMVDQLSIIAVKLLAGFLASDALLAEINPLAVLGNGQFVAADAKMEIDDSALFRQKDLAARGLAMDELEREAKEIGVTYIKLDGGNVGIIASGAGLSMNTMDLVHEAGLKPANFLETGGGITSELVRRAMDLVTRDERVRGVVVNLYGGVNSLLEAAKGLVAGVQEMKRPIPLVVKALGNQQEECWQMLESIHIPVIKSHRTEDAIAYIKQQLEGQAS
ncbi:MAG: acetate--CoA ligase family protein [Negativicutes bacterium]|nr:acetate--CoA ligase family protein [Negativicutes bacterium]